MPAFTPREYQEKAIEFLVERPQSGLFLSPGLGKTACTLAAFKVLRSVGFVKRMLVVAPLRPCYLVWPPEVKLWDDFREFSIGVLHGPKKEKVLNTPHDIFVINPEGLRWLSRTLRGNMPFDMLVVDESGKFKSINTDRFKTIKPLLPKFKRRIILTGSPTPNTMLDIFGQMYLLDLGKTLSPYITQFRSNFFTKRTFEVKHPNPERAANGEMLELTDWKISPEKEKLLYDCIAPKVLRMSDEDYLKMPPLIVNDVFVDLPPEARKAYDELERGLRIEFKAGRVTAANAAIKSMQCRQMANGGIYLDGSTNKWENVHMAKADAVAELVEELSGNPALITYEFQHDLQRLRMVLGKATPHIGGGVTPKQAEQIVADWNSGQLPALLGQPQSMAHGLNMHMGGDTVIFHSMVWSYDNYDQFIRRVRRAGKTRPVTLHRIIARNTVDELVMAAMTRKERTQETFFEAIKQYWS
jgi:SNF2 family DNA or RNA helicase